MKTLGEMGEHEAIRRLTQNLGGNPYLCVGVGDDCAVVEIPGTGMDQVFTTDPIIEGTHFLAFDEPCLIGNKAAGRVLSDIAAMGAQPQWMMVNVVAPLTQDFDFLERIYEGIVTLGRRFGATVIGGDMAQSSRLALHVFGTGILPSGTALLRSGARPGDHIYVTGSLGDSIKGKHLDFVPRVEEGIFLRETGLVNSMMDISDGLATDLRHIMSSSGVGAVLDADAIPKNGSLDQALYDGEDFELLFTVSPQNAAQLNIQWEQKFAEKIPRIGTVSEEVDVLHLRLPDGDMRLLEEKAYEHFRV